MIELNPNIGIVTTEWLAKKGYAIRNYANTLRSIAREVPV